MIPMKMRLLCLCTLAAMFSSCCCCTWFSSGPKVWITEEVIDTLPADGLSAVEVDTYNGRITIVAKEGATEVEYHARIKAGGQDDLDASACREAIRLLTEVEGDRLHIYWIWDEQKSNGWGASVDYTLHVPAGLFIDGETYNGAIELKNSGAGCKLITYNGCVDAWGIEGETQVETYNGDIYIKGKAARINLITYNGTITAKLAEVPTLAGDLETNNGNIMVTLAGKPSTRVMCRTTNGQIHMGGPMKITYEKKRRMEGVMGDGEGLLDLETYNGSITVN